MKIYISGIFFIFIILSLGLISFQSSIKFTLYTIIIGSNGELIDAHKNIFANDAEADLDKISTLLKKSFGIYNYRAEIIRISEQNDSYLFHNISQLFRYTDSSDLFMSVICGAWRKDTAHLELSYLISEHQDRITVEYLINMIDFCKAQNAMIFILAPSEFAFPSEVFGNPTNHFETGGKYFIILRMAKNIKYEEMLEKYKDILSNLQLDERVDLDNNNIITISEMLNQFVALSEKEHFQMDIYPIASSSNLKLKNLKSE
jgi:hypothetical protein